MELLLIRHGHIAGDPYIKPSRPVNGCLSAEGITQAGRLRRALAGIPITNAYCSSYGRAIQTAEIALAGRDIPFQIIDPMHEWLPAANNKGLASAEHETLLEQEKARFPEMTYKTELGEGLFEMYARIIPPFLSLLEEQGVAPRYGGFIVQPESDKKILAIFAHGGSLNIILSHLLKVPPFPIAAFNFELTGLARICFQQIADVYYPALVISDVSSNETRCPNGDSIQHKNEPERNSQDGGGFGGNRVLCLERQRRGRAR